MTPERFRTLAEAYGADPARWPAAERDAALALVARRDPDTMSVLADAAMLDRMLAAHTVAAPDPALVRRVVASAPARRNPGRRRDAWYSGIGLAGVGLAGVAAGMLAMSLLATRVTTPTASELSYSTTAFGSAPSDWSDE
jgi:hypothetical protein